MRRDNTNSGKIIPALLIVVVLMIAAFCVGYFLSVLRFNQKIKQMNESYAAFEGKYERVLSDLRSEQMEIQAYIKEKEGTTEKETDRLRMMGILLKAKGEIISSKLALSRNDMNESLERLNSAITVLRDAFNLADESNQLKIEDIRLQLATVKGVMEVNSAKAQKELDKLWRELDTIVEK